MLTIKLLTTAGGHYELEVQEGQSVQNVLDSKGVSVEGATVRFQAQTGATQVVAPTAPAETGTYVVTKNVSNGS